MLSCLSPTNCDPTHSENKGAPVQRLMPRKAVAAAMSTRLVRMKLTGASAPRGAAALGAGGDVRAVFMATFPPRRGADRQTPADRHVSPAICGPRLTG